MKLEQHVDALSVKIREAADHQQAAICERELRRALSLEADEELQDADRRASELRVVAGEGASVKEGELFKAELWLRDKRLGVLCTRMDMKTPIGTSKAAEGLKVTVTTTFDNGDEQQVPDSRA